MNQPASASNEAQASLSPSSDVLLTAYIDLYKHHYELWLRGFFVYLGVLGVVAGFLFSKDPSLPEERNLLLVFIVAASTVAIIAFYVGLRWLSGFEKAFGDVCSGPGAPPLAIASFKCLIIMAMVVAIAFSLAAIFIAVKT